MNILEAKVGTVLWAVTAPSFAGTKNSNRDKWRN